MISDFPSFADLLDSVGQTTGSVEVTLSNELVHLLSDQLYQSASKAIEELVVNAYDADATECRVFVPDTDPTHKFIVVYDNGTGMDKEGLQDLWHIGRSSKRNEEIERRAKRKQIGKFGIGKLATYAIANKVTYLTRKENNFLLVTLNFNQFVTDPSGGHKPVNLSVKEIVDSTTIAQEATFKEICALACIDLEALFSETVPSWTFVILEDLKEKADSLRINRLRWVLSTAMPLTSDFHLILNCEEVVSSKAAYEPIISFKVGELPDKTLQRLSKNTEEEWRSDGENLYSDSFPSGISGDVMVTKQSLLTGKSSDIGRSHGFFIRVRNRLVNEEDAYFGLREQTFDTFYRFRAVLRVDDLDNTIKASREGVGVSEQKDKLIKLLSALFYEADSRRDKYYVEEVEAEKRKKESEREYVNRLLVEYPIADALTTQSHDSVEGGADADESWFYLEIDSGTDINALAQSLYAYPRTKYSYAYTLGGSTGRLVKFNPGNYTFYINAEHELVIAHADNGRAKVLLEDLLTAEVLLEIYLRTSDVPPHTIGAVLERRDILLRSLAKDHPFSLTSISNALRESAADKYDLEIMQVEAARALGFVAKHISGSGEPDGLARFLDYLGGEKKITLEAKSSKTIPQLSQLDFAGLREHVDRYGADGCLLIAPSYPGRDSDSAVSARAVEGRISCWTIDQLARVVADAETRHFTARQVLDIVLRYFAPEEVAEAINRLFSEPNWEMRELYKAVLEALEQLQGRLSDRPRTLDMVAGEVSRGEKFRSISMEQVERAIIEITNASQGILVYRGGVIHINGSLSEVERRLDGLTGGAGDPRKPSTFRNGFSSQER